MIPYEELTRIAWEAGSSACAPLHIRTLRCKSEVRDMCAGNSCGQYGRRWSCPPGCGTLEECLERINGYSQGILIQTIGELEDSFDAEAMAEAERRHKESLAKMLKLLRCRQCSYPDAPCRFPGEAVSSMEAYGLLVSQVCRDNHLDYYYGSDKIAYTGCFLL